MFDFDQRRHGQPKRAQKKSNHATLIYPDDSTEASSWQVDEAAGVDHQFRSR